MTGISLDRMRSIGDPLDVDGNDIPVKALGVECVGVDGWARTAASVESLLDAAAAGLHRQQSA